MTGPNNPLPAGIDHGDRAIPGRAFVISLAALSVPVIAILAFPDQWGDYEVLVWLTALIPPFLLAYYRGWQGVATALAAGMVVMTLVQIVVLLQDRRASYGEIFLPVVGTYLAIGAGIGVLAEMIHRERREAMAAAMTDAVTGLANRRLFEDYLSREFAAAERGRELVLVLFDVDDFKKYNDAHGHRAGDVALRAFGEVLAACTRRMNVSARYGGEEFVSIVSAGDAAGARVFVQRVQDRLAEAPPPAAPITVCAGIAAYQPTMASPDELVEAADEALYRAKAQGRGCVAVHGTQSADVSGRTGDAAETGPVGAQVGVEEGL